MRKESEVRGGGPCGAPPASIPLPAVAVAAPLPQRPIGRDRGAARWCGDKTWKWGQDFELGKWGRVAGEVHYIAIWPGDNTKSSSRFSIASEINEFDGSPFEFKDPISPGKPSLECLCISGLQWEGGA
jgi:hypothetical protein